MSGLALALGFVVAFCLGACFVRTSVAPRLGFANFAMWAGLSLGLGIGISTFGFGLWTVLPTIAPGWFIVIEAAVLSLAAFASHHMRAPKAVTPATPSISSALRSGPWLALAGAASIVAATILFFEIYDMRSHGEWDAWAMYNARARFLFRDPENWIAAFQLNHYFNPDYPVMLPLTVARLWTWSGSETTLAPALVGYAFLVATTLVLFGALAKRRSFEAAALGSLLLLSTQTLNHGLDSFVHLSAYQMADVPLAFFLLAALVCVSGADTDPGRNASLALGGLAASLAAWTKNEGLLFVIVLFAATFALEFMRRGARESLRTLVPMAAGAAPFMAIVLAYKGLLAPDNFTIGADNVDAIAKLGELGRYGQVLASLAHWVLYTSGGAIVILALAVAGLGLRRRSERLAAALPAVVILIVLAGYSVVFVITRIPLQWHLDSAQARLLMHLWPSAVFAGFLLAKKPQPLTLTSSRPRASDRVPTGP